MKLTRDEFVKRWRYSVCGMALFGTTSERCDGPMARAAKMCDIPAEVEKLLAAIYDSLKPDDLPLPVKPGAPKEGPRK